MKGRRMYDDGGIVANTILTQLGGAGRLRMMTGAYNFVDLGNGLSFKIKNQRANYIKIVLTSMDLYDVEVGRIRGNTYKVVASAEGLYFDQLKPFIEKSTGMYLSLFGSGGMVEHKTDDGEVLKYKIDTDEMSVEVDYPTMEYLSENGIVMKHESRKLRDTYIFWYDQIANSSREELEEVLEIELPVHYRKDDDDDYYEYKNGGMTQKKYKLGDKWSDDFDYNGMLRMGLKADTSFGVKKLQKLFDSFEDVNYHTASENLWKAIQALKMSEEEISKNDIKTYGSVEQARKNHKDMANEYIEQFHDDVLEEMMSYRRGGKVKIKVKKKRVRFVDKVESIADRLENTKVPKRLKKDYGGRYNREEAEEAGRRIAGAQLRDRKMMADGGVAKQKITIKSYNIHGQEIQRGDVVVDFDNETIQFPSGKVFKVVPDREYTVKFQKTQVKAADGINGLVRFIEEINNPDSPFNPAYTSLMLEK